jgi:hypothetical protein
VPLYWSVRVGDQLYSWWPVGFPLLSLPFYVGLGWLGLYAMPILAGAACAGLAGLLVRQIQPRSGWLAPAAALVTGLATPVAFYRPHSGNTPQRRLLTGSCGRHARAASSGALLLAGALGAVATWPQT